MLDLESQGLGSIPTGGKCHFLFYNPNLHNIARSGRIRFKMKNPTGYSLIQCAFFLMIQADFTYLPNVTQCLFNKDSNDLISVPHTLVFSLIAF